MNTKMCGWVRWLGLLPAVAVLTPWAVLWLLGGRECVGILTGMPPAGVDFEVAVLLGFGYVAASLLGTVFGVPLLVTGLVAGWVWGRSAG